MESTDANHAVPAAEQPHLYAAKTAMVLWVLFIIAWAYYLFSVDTLLRSLLAAVGAPRGLALIALLAVFMAGIFGAFYGLMWIAIRVDLRLNGLSSAAAATRHGARQAEKQIREMLETEVAQLEKEGASPEVISEYRKTIEDGLAKSSADAEQRARRYEQNPELAEHDARVVIEGIRAKQRLKDF